MALYEFTFGKQPAAGVELTRQPGRCPLEVCSRLSSLVDAGRWGATWVRLQVEQQLHGTDEAGEKARRWAAAAQVSERLGAEAVGHTIRSSYSNWLEERVLPAGRGTCQAPPTPRVADTTHSVPVSA